MTQERVLIADVTLRDGEQAPQVGMTTQNKIKAGLSIIDLGVDILEAGFPASSQEDFDVVSYFAENAPSSVIVSALCRCKKEDIELASKALLPAIQTHHARLHLFIPTSFEHIQCSLNQTPQETLKNIQESVAFAKQFCMDIEFSAEDSSRSDFNFLLTCCQIAIDAGATTINIPDTVGEFVDTQMQELVENLRKKLKRTKNVVFSVHCHNDKGLATANSLFGIKGGARQVECCMNGLGERAGNTALEEVIMALSTSPTRYPYTTNIQTQKLVKVSQEIERLTHFKLSLNKPVVGKNVFTHASGVHQDAIIKALQHNYSPMYSAFSPELVGAHQQILISRHSGLNGLKYVFQKIKLSPSKQELNQILNCIKENVKHPKCYTSSELIRLYYQFHKSI